MKIISVEKNDDETAIKVLQLTDDNYVIETGVFDDKKTVHLCISSQIGCSVGCKMCYNGLKKTYNRNLTTIEIVSQAENIIDKFKLSEKYENIWFSFMGVGEPLLNINNVINSIYILDKKYYGSYFSLATTVPSLTNFYILTDKMNKINNFKLTISLHSAIEEKRKWLIPIHNSLKELRDAMEYYKKNGNHKCEWNYVLLKDFNDGDYDYNVLLDFLQIDDRIKISSYNPIELGKFEKCPEDRCQLLHFLLNQNGIYNSNFNSVGDSINVGCGQMASKKLEKIKENKNV